MTRSLATALVLCLVTACTHVDSGNVGIKVVSCGSGTGVDPHPLGVGWWSSWGCTSIIEFPTFQQTAAFKDGEALTVNDSMGLPIVVDAVLNFTIDGAKAPAIYSKYKKEIDVIMASSMRQTVYGAMKSVYSSYTAQQLYSEKQEVSRVQVETILRDKLGSEGFVVEQFSINKTTPPEDVVKAIRAKVAMIEDAQRVEQELRKTKAEAEKVIAQAQGAADAAIIQAKGAAEARRITADSEAYTNRTVSASINPVLNDYLRAKKWDGVGPTIVGGGGGTSLLVSTGASAGRAVK